jgi:two-component system response regulator DesR
VSGNAVEVVDDGRGPAEWAPAPPGRRPATASPRLRERAADAGARSVSVGGGRRGRRLPAAGGLVTEPAPPSTCGSLLADDQALVRGALAALLQLEPDLEVVGEVSRGDEVVAAALELRRDVALIDVEMPGMDGIAATAELRAGAAGLPGADRARRSAGPATCGARWRPGASGFVVKDTPAGSSRTPSAGCTPGCASSTRAGRGDADLGDSPLTPRETDLLRRARDGGTVADLAARAHLVGGHGAQLPVVRDGQDRRPDARRGRAHRRGERLALPLTRPAARTRAPAMMDGVSDFDAVLFDAGGVLLLPAPGEVRRILEPFGGDRRRRRLIRAHFAAAHAMDRARADGDQPSGPPTTSRYARSAGVPRDRGRRPSRRCSEHRHPRLWYHPVPGARDGARRLVGARRPDRDRLQRRRQVEGELARLGICAGSGTCTTRPAGTPVRRSSSTRPRTPAGPPPDDAPPVPVACVVDSHVVGVAEARPAHLRAGARPRSGCRRPRGRLRGRHGVLRRPRGRARPA